MRPKNKETFVRINSRVRADQLKFVKTYAKSRGIGEGEAHRIILDEFMSNLISKKTKKNES